jgi:Glycosyl transferase family 2
MKVHFCNRMTLEGATSIGKEIAVISLRNGDKPPAKVAGGSAQASGVAVLDVVCDDIDEPMPHSVCPTPAIAKNIYDFWAKHKDQVGWFVCQCETGLGLSQAVSAAILLFDGQDPNPILRQAAYNRSLYRLILEQAGRQPPPEPLVSIVCRILYPADRFQAFVLCMDRQRYPNWEVIGVTDGPRPDVAALLSSRKDGKVRLLETPERLGSWGHPYRQMGIDAARGEIIGLQNDDNYLVPGFVEQLVWVIQDGAQMVLCDTVHSYFGWAYQQVQPRRAGCDLGAFLARTSLFRQVQWPGNNQDSDGDFIERMASAAGQGIATIRKPLFIHN